MSLKQRISYLIIAVFIIQTGAYAFLNYGMHSRTVDNLEQQHLKMGEERVRYAVQNDLSRVERITIDYLQWDDTYGFMASHDKSFTEKNFSIDTMNNLGIDVCVFINENGQADFELELDPITKMPVSVASSVTSLATSGMVAGPTGRIFQSHTAIANLPGGYLIYSLQPILKSDRTGPARGMGLMGKWLDKNTLKNYEAVTGVALRFHDGDSAGTPTLFISDSEAEIPITFTDSKTSSSCKLIGSIDRNLHQHGLIHSRLFTLATLIIGLLATIILLYCFNRMFLRRIQKLSEHVKILSDNDMCSIITQNNQQDEISQLANNINTLHSKLKQSHIDLKAKEDQLLHVLERSPLAITISDRSGKLLMVNERYHRITGYTAEELGTIKHLQEVILPDPDYRQYVFTKIEENARISMEEGLPPIPVEYKFKNKTGREVEVELLSVETGGLLFRVINDVSSRNQIIRELRAAMSRAQTANSAKSQFLANMSHEIRTPLNGIVGMAQLLRETDIKDNQLDYIDSIMDSCDLLVAVINDILDISKVEAGKLLLNKESIELRSFLASVEGIAGPAIETKGLQFICDFSPDLPATVMCDPNRLKQVLLNLLSNAGKFTEKGSITFRVIGNGTPGRISNIHSEVIDTGMGITEEDQTKIFEPFMQADFSNTRQHGGTGLGLTISRKLVQLMGGDINVTSERGKGSSFGFDILVPVMEAHTAKNRANEKIDADLRDRCPMSILVVEDNLVNQKVTGLMLQKMGYKPDFATNGKIALAMVMKKPYDVVLMDVQMPVMDGLTATSEIRLRVPKDNQPVIIALTAHALGEEMLKCKDAGMDEYLTKPLSVTILGHMLADVFNNIITHRKE